MKDIVTARNKVTRQVGEYPRRFVEHVILGRFLEEVPFGTKPHEDLKDKVEKKRSATTKPPAKTPEEIEEETE